MNYKLIMKHMDDQYIDRLATAKKMVAAYPGYSDATRQAWFDALDGALEVRKQAYINASEALNNAFKNI